MTAFISHTSIDCRNAFTLSEWWKEVLGYRDVPGDPNEPGHDECMIVPDGDGDGDGDGAGDGPVLLFIEVPERKSVKNRIHLDLRPAAGATREQELERLLGLGARTLDDLRRPDGRGWVTLADPEGNEFCILRSQQDADHQPDHQADDEADDEAAVAG